MKYRNHYLINIDRLPKKYAEDGRMTEAIVTEVLNMKQVHFQFNLKLLNFNKAKIVEKLFVNH